MTLCAALAESVITMPGHEQYCKTAILVGMQIYVATSHKNASTEHANSTR